MAAQSPNSPIFCAAAKVRFRDDDKVTPEITAHCGHSPIRDGAMVWAVIAKILDRCIHQADIIAILENIRNVSFCLEFTIR